MGFFLFVLFFVGKLHFESPVQFLAFVIMYVYLKNVIKIIIFEDY